jgi:hypothetical protein
LETYTDLISVAAILSNDFLRLALVSGVTPFQWTSDIIESRFRLLWAEVNFSTNTRDEREVSASFGVWKPDSANVLLIDPATRIKRQFAIRIFIPALFSFLE